MTRDRRHMRLVRILVHRCASGRPQEVFFFFPAMQGCIQNRPEQLKLSEHADLINVVKTVWESSLQDIVDHCAIDDRGVWVF